MSYLLVEWSMPLLVFVGIGVGFAAFIGTVRFKRRWSLKNCISKYKGFIGVILWFGPCQKTSAIERKRMGADRFRVTPIRCSLSSLEDASRRTYNNG